jgi:hypothetical protein
MAREVAREAPAAKAEASGDAGALSEKALRHWRVLSLHATVRA